MPEQIGRYKVLSELGRGAMGVVYKAQDPTIGRLVAIKTIRLGELAHPEEREQLRTRLFREAQSAGILSHPGIVTIYDISEESNLAYITMEYVEGQTLEKMLDTGLVEDAKRLVSIATQTAVALDYAHNKGIVHRDIKPGNIMVNPDWAVKITDFGIARIASSKFTHTGTVMGTPSYMSPEQVRGAVVDGRSDMFSLAVVLYEMLTGQKPFSGDSITTVIFKIVSENPVSPKELNPSIGAKVNAVVMRALAKEPAERYQSCKEFAEALQLAVDQTANLTVAARKIDSLYAPTEVSNAALLTQPDTKAEMRAAERRESSPPPVPAAAPPPSVSEAAPLPIPATERRLPPLEAKPSSAPKPKPEPAPTVLAKPAAKRRTGLLVTLTLAALVAAGAAGVFLQRWQSEPSAPVTTPPASAPPESAPSPSHLPETKAPPPAEKAQAEPPPATLGAGEATTPAGQPGAGTPAATPPVEAVPKPLAGVRAINVVTSEPGARVVMDGVELTACTTPCSIPARPGRHSLLLSRAGFHPANREVMVANGPADLQVTLSAILGTIMLSTAPPGARITVDGKAVDGETPKTLKLPPGRHDIAVSKEGAGSSQQTVEITEDSLIPLRLTLSP